MEYRCIGCGTILQSKNENKPGYVSEEILNSGKDNIVCKRCFQIKNYNFISKNEMPIETYYKIISNVTKSNSLFVYVVNVFDLDSSVDTKIIEMIKNKDVILVVNKIDLLPKSMNKDHIRDYLKKYFHKLGLNEKSLVLLSSEKNYNIDALVEIMDRLRKDRDVYVLGNTNVGKSSLINSIIKAVGIFDKDVITTSIIPATTLSPISIPLFVDGAIYDTPGLVPESNILSIADSKDYKTLLPDKEIKPISYQIEEGNSVNIGGFALVNYIGGDENSFIFYKSNNLELLRSKTDKALTMYPNRSKELFKINTNIVETKEYKFRITKPSDICLSGLAFITIKKPGVISVNVPENVKVVVRDAIFG